jgi:hypothetical protein
MIRIYVPFTFIHPPTWEALAGRIVTPWLVDDGNGYLEYFRVRWAAERDFINIEHDVVVQPGQLEQLDDCEAGWCVIPELNGSPSMSLVRYRADFIRANKDIWTDQWVCPAGQGKPWTWLDSHLQSHADRAPCEHRSIPAVNTRPFGPAH